MKPVVQYDKYEILTVGRFWQYKTRGRRSVLLTEATKSRAVPTWPLAEGTVASRVLANVLQSKEPIKKKL